MNYMKKAVYLLFAIYLSGCIGTTEVDRQSILPDADQELRVNVSDTAVLVTESAQLTVSLFENGEDKGVVEADWNTSDANIVSVNNGLVTGNSVGYAYIWTEYNGLQSDSTVVNVVATSTELAVLSISSSTTNLLLGDSVRLSFSGMNLNGEDVTVTNETWMSSNEDVASFMQDGWLHASETTGGMTNVQLLSGDVMSNILSFNVVDLSAQTRTGTIVEAGGHFSEGDVVLMENLEGDIILQFKDNFVSQSGPGLYIYLSNTESDIVANGLEIVALPQTSGAFELNLSDSFPTLELDTYSKVIVHCKPFNVPFGIADLN